MVPLPRNGPQRSGHSASTMLGVLFKRRHPPCRGDRGGSMSFWPPPSAPWSLDPGVRRENDERDRRQTRPLSRFSDFRHAFYVSSALSLVSPRKRGPRSRGGVAATERTSAQRAFRRRDARVHAPFVSPAKAGAQEPRWGRCHGADLSAAGVPSARCRASFRQIKPVLWPGCDSRHALVADSLWSSVEIHSDPVRTLLYPYA